MRKILAAAAFLSACGGDTGPGLQNASAMVVDSARTPDASLALLREGVVRAGELRGGASSREALVRGLVEALANGDTARAVGMHLSRSEFAWLYYPTSAGAQSGRQLDPGLMWSLIRLESEKGLDRLFERLGGMPLEYVGHRCEAAARSEGRNRLWERCGVDLRGAPADFRARRLFGTILERDGHFKFVSYKTDL